MQYAIIYMAAGNSRRFGKENKLLQEFQGKPLYRHGLDLLLDVVAEKKNVRLIVITQYKEILEEVEKYKTGGKWVTSADSLEEAEMREKRQAESRISCFLNPDSRKGVSYTIRRGVEEALAAGPVDYFLFMTADQPFLGRETLENFLRTADGEKTKEAERKTQEPEGKTKEAERETDAQEHIKKNMPGRYPVVSAACGEQPGNPVMFRADLAEELMRLQADEGGRKVWRRYARQGILVQVRDRRELQDMDVWEDMKNISTE